jgi:DNA transposition AAA+ family ATPase
VTEQGDITDILTDKDRILRVAWALPNDGPLTDEQRGQAMENFRGYCKRHGITLDAVARQLGSPGRTTIQDLIDGTYRKNADAHVRKINLWLEQHAKQRVAELGENFVTTRVAKAMLACAKLIRENGTMGMALGPCGIGKSRCAQAIHETYVGSIYVRVINGYHHPRGLTGVLADRLSVDKTSTFNRAGIRSQLERVIDRLSDTNRLLVIDEAHKLNAGALEVLRDIHDSAGVPIMLIGTAALHDRIMEAVGPDAGQLYSRFDIVHHLTQGKDVYEGGKPLFTVAEIKELYDVVPIRLAADAARYLQGLANQLGYGSLRRCKILLRNAARRARKRQGLGDEDRVTVTADDLEWVEARLRQEASEQDLASDRRRRAVGAVTA